MDRRDLLRSTGLAAAGSVALAGCTNPEDEDADTPRDGEEKDENQGTEPAVGERDQTQATPEQTAAGGNETAAGGGEDRTTDEDGTATGGNQTATNGTSTAMDEDGSA